MRASIFSEKVIEYLQKKSKVQIFKAKIRIELFGAYVGFATYVQPMEVEI